MEEHRVQGVALRLEHAGLHLHPMGAEDLHALAGYQRVGIQAAHHHPADAGGENGVRAGGLASGVAAGLQGHIQGSPRRILPAVRQGGPLGVEAAAPGVPALADDVPVPHQDGPHQGVGADPASAPLRKLRRQAQIVLVVQCHRLRKKDALNQRFRAS